MRIPQPPVKFCPNVGAAARPLAPKGSTKAGRAGGAGPCLEKSPAKGRKGPRRGIGCRYFRERVGMSPIDTATVCWMGFHSMLPNTANSMASPKENTKNGYVKAQRTFLAVGQ